eukprot:scaffold105327_cov69-Phaeocystis_antarctica.AAC.1
MRRQLTPVFRAASHQHIASIEQIVTSWHLRPGRGYRRARSVGGGHNYVNIFEYRLSSEGRSEAGDRKAMAQDCARSCSGRTRTRT